MTKIKTLIIAPYEGLEDVIRELVKQYPQIDPDIYVADLNDDVSLLKELDMNDYEAIISRGGNAELIKSHTSLPVIEISISICDLLRGIKIAESFSKNFVIAGFRIFTDGAVLLCNLLQYKTPIYTITKEEEVDGYLDEIEALYGKDTVILCDQVMHSHAGKKGITSILITSGNESIHSAFDQTIQIINNKRSDQMLVKCLEASLKSNDIRQLIYNSDQVCIYSSQFEEQEHKWILKNIQDIFQRKKTMDHGTFRHKANDSRMLKMVYSKIMYLDQDYHVFTITDYQKSPFSQMNALTIFHYQELQSIRTRRIHNLISFSKDFINQLQDLSTSSYPVLFVGEPGTGKDQGAYYMYEMGNRTSHPLYVIDAALLNEKQWKHLISHENSPFYDVDSTIYIKNIQALKEEAFSWLTTQLLYPSFYQSNKYIFSIVKEEKGNSDHYNQLLSNHNSILRLYYPALRERKDQFAEYCALYLNEYNTRLGRQVIGFAPNAFELMKNYSWPYNLDQLKRILKELIIKSTSPYIKYEDVEFILRAESHKDHTLFDGQYGIDIKKTLEEINKEIVLYVLEEENGNQTKAAKRLGISRGTIWRMLKE